MGKKKELNCLAGKSMREHHAKFMSLGMSQDCAYIYIYAYICAGSVMESKPVSSFIPWNLPWFLPQESCVEFLPWLPLMSDYDWEVKAK